MVLKCAVDGACCFTLLPVQGGITSQGPTIGPTSEKGNAVGGRLQIQLV